MNNAATKTGLVIAMIVFTSQALALTVNVNDRSNFNSAQSQKLDQAVVILNQVLNGAEFRDAVLNFTYQGQKQFVQNNGMTNAEIYDYLMEGAEKYPNQTDPNLMADMKLTIYYPSFFRRFSSAVAFTGQNDEFLHIYNSYYSNASLPDLSETLVHEWTHKMGFDHDFNATAQRRYSVPYGIGGIINTLVTKLTH